MIFPVFYTGLYTAVSELDPRLREMAKVYRVPKSKVFTGLILPSISPHLFSSMQSAFSLNLKVVIAAEIAGGVARNTIGNFMTAARYAGDYAAMFGWVIAAVVTAFIFEWIITLAGRLCMPWKYAEKTIRTDETNLPKTDETREISDRLRPVSVPPPTALSFKNVDFSYPQKKVLAGFSEEFEAGKVYAVMGGSGTGKTTVLNLAAGLIKPDAGFISRSSGDAACYGTANVSYMFQEPRLITQRTVIQNLVFTLYPAYKTKEKKRKETLREVREAAKKYLSAVGLNGSENLYPHQLSGGMAQRVSLARAFSFPGSVLLMDEAFKGLDDMLKKQIIKLFLNLQKAEPRTVLFVTHDDTEAEQVADKIIRLNK
jgi:ABC-type nitrate/sulfonate/bicarbonate transport system ATPase subunit